MIGGGEGEIGVGLSRAGLVHGEEDTKVFGLQVL